MAIDLVEVSKTYAPGAEHVLVLDRASLRVEPGEMVALMGPSGSGKSTVINLCAGLDVADSGEVTVLGHRLEGLSQRDRSLLRLWELGVVFQDDNLLQELTAVENVALPLRARGVRRRQALQAAAEQLALLGIDDLAGRRPNQMSGGQQQRVGIARALVGDKQVLLADEPSGSLDRAATADVFQALREVADSGAAALVATHDPAVHDWADRLVQVFDGDLTEDAVGVRCS